MNYVDLHCHTTASDGTLAPSQLVARALEFGLKTIAVTDHDTTDGVAEALTAGAAAGIEVLPGIEINTDVPGGEIHVLGYFIDVTDAPFQAELRRLRAGRERRGEEITRRLSALGVPISWQRVQEIAGDAPIGRPHIARALLEAGHVNSMNEAFTLYIGRDGPAYVERMRFTPVEAVQTIKRVGGAAAAAALVGAAESPAPAGCGQRWWSAWGGVGCAAAGLAGGLCGHGGQEGQLHPPSGRRVAPDQSAGPARPCGVAAATGRRLRADHVTGVCVAC